MTLLRQILIKGILDHEDLNSLIERQPLFVRNLTELYGLTIPALRRDLALRYFEFSDFENGINELLNYNEPLKNNSLKINYRIKKFNLKLSRNGFFGKSRNSNET